MYGIAQNANKHPGGFAAWRGISAFLGGQTLLAAAIAWFMLGTPNEVRWLSAREKSVANARILSNNAGTDLTGKKEWKWSQVREAFLDPVLYFQFVNAFLNCVVSFFDTFDRRRTHDDRSTGLLPPLELSSIVRLALPSRRSSCTVSPGMSYRYVTSMFGLSICSPIQVLYFAAVGYTSLRFVNIR